MLLVNSEGGVSVLYSVGLTPYAWGFFFTVKSA